LVHLESNNSRASTFANCVLPTPGLHLVDKWGVVI
jgi:hypothetical protein